VLRGYDAALKVVPKNSLVHDAVGAYAIQQCFGSLVIGVPSGGSKMIIYSNHDEQGVPSYFLLLRILGLGW
jgi:hypothetical protein